MSLRSLLTAVAIFALAVSPVMATSLPYTSNFASTSNGSLPPEYTAVAPTGNGVSPVVEGNPGSPALQFSVTSSGAGSSQAYLTDNSNAIGSTPGTGFTYSATFTVPTYHYGSSSDTVAFKLIALDNDSSSDPNSSSKGYIADFNMPTYNGVSASNGTLTLSSLGGDFTAITSSAVSTNYTSNTYTLTLRGTYLAGGDLQLTGSIYDGSSTQSVTATTTTPGLVDNGSNNVFSMRLASNDTSYATVDVSSVSLAVTPEPASIGLLALGSLGLLSRRRRAAH